MAAALSRSQDTELARRPYRSASGVSSVLVSRYGTISAAATSPRSVALPVSVSTNHGIATSEIRLPSVEPMSALISAMKLLLELTGRCRPAATAACSSAQRARNACLSTFSDRFSGNRSRNCTACGAHISFSDPVTSSISSASVTAAPGARTTKACGTSPTVSSGTPITAAASTCGCSAIASSIGRQKIAQFRRWVTIMSCTRSTRYR